jgi:hypothetical protein
MDVRSTIVQLVAIGVLYFAAISVLAQHVRGSLGFKFNAARNDFDSSGQITLDLVAARALASGLDVLDFCRNQDSELF